MNTSHQIMQAKEQIEAIMGGGDGAGAYNSGGGGCGVYQLEYDL